MKDWKILVACPNGHKWQVPLECKDCPKWESEARESGRDPTWLERRRLARALRKIERGRG